MTVKQDEDPALPTMPAVLIAHTPTGPVPCCMAHAKALQGLMRFMSAYINFTSAPDDTECTNCLNEASKV